MSELETYNRLLLTITLYEGEINNYRQATEAQLIQMQLRLDELKEQLDQLRKSFH